MALRLGGLSDLDLLAVPLPAGTEITTRVDREHDGVLRPQGAVGRVVGTAGDTVEISFLDGKRGRYLRHEVVPRKLGVVRYAQRRAASWQALAPCIVVDAQVGSRAWGLAHEGSDDDRRGVFVLPFPWTTGLVDPPLDLVSLDGSLMYWEIGKAIRQALRADPNTLEMLFSTVVATDELGEVLLASRQAFLSREIYGSFGRYALSQLDRLEHNQRLAEHRSLLLRWLADEPTLGLDAAAARLAESAAIAAPSQADAVRRGRDYLKQLYRSLYDQGLLASNEWSALVAFASAGQRDFEPPRDLRPKNAYNLIRLLDLAIRWLRGEPPVVQVAPELRPALLAIKRGEVPMAEVMERARQLTPELEAARDGSPLPRVGDLGRAEAALREVRALAAARWLRQGEGPWGKGAAPPPLATFDDPISTSSEDQAPSGPADPGLGDV